MTDERDDTSPAELDEVRHLLREARHHDPIPTDVGARLDGVLADLSRERADAVPRTPTEADVIPLDPRRRRRAAGLLVAAAAIVVGGVTAAQHLSHASGGQSATAGGGISTSADASQGYASGTEKTPSTAPGPAAQAPMRTEGGRVLVRPGQFSADVLSARQATSTAPSDTLRTHGLKAVSPGCVPDVGQAQVVAATYEKAPAALVYHAPQGSTQVVDLYICGSTRPVRSVTLPTP